MSGERRRALRWTAEERLQRVVDDDDEGASSEGEWAPGGSIWVGSGKVGGQPVALLVSDVRADRGALSEAGGRAAAARVRDARDAREPILWLVDSDGARVDEGLGAVEQSAALLGALADAQGRCLRIAVCHGFAGGVAAYGLALCDLAVGIQDRSFTFVAGPGVIQAAIGQSCALEDVGSTALHEAAGTLAATVRADPEALAWAREILSLSAPVAPRPPRSVVWDLPDPRRPYDVGRVLDALLDQGDEEGPLTEVFGRAGEAARVGFGRLDGLGVAVVASQPCRGGGAIDARTARKIARFLDVAVVAGLPVLTLCDTPGFLPGPAEERAGVLVEGAGLIHAYARARAMVLTASVVLRRAVGAGAVLALGSRTRLALPGAEMLQMGDRAASAAYGAHRALAAAPSCPVVSVGALRDRLCVWRRGEERPS